MSEEELKILVLINDIEEKYSNVSKIRIKEIKRFGEKREFTKIFLLRLALSEIDTMLLEILQNVNKALTEQVEELNNLDSIFEKYEREQKDEV